jgi:anti-sigma28 factor (negative regulator of flagellin synthesis)
LFSDTIKAAKASVSERLSGEGIDISSIKNQIESGNYSIDENQLAESILMLTGYYERGKVDND